MVTILQCQCTRDLDPLRRKRLERYPIWFVPGLFLMILEPPTDLSLVKNLQHGAALLPRAAPLLF